MQNHKTRSRVERHLAWLLATTPAAATPPPGADATLVKVDLFYPEDADPGALKRNAST
ncbi:hypothetical protein [Nocardioides sp. PD653]|uniref:hypothetical protein n=1 Tax=Nocardioides sp. PD653 TaxID=393303 RepID=UPI0009F0444B|nr:hypothetical protein [Nocardioides sp. PD653]GAW54766.1 Palmitoyltransferase [Nocardioides sp. PD653]